MSDKFDLRDDDVIHANSSVTFDAGSTFKVSQLMQAIRKYMGNSTSFVKWFTDEGVECQVLQIYGGGWQKGRLRFRLEFIPDQPEAPESPSSPEPTRGIRFTLR
ncbi:KGK domain-containing protein [Scytonema sp. PCC 10023]|uniref:KGK domain-containing protein n=1 Tax=Scytonema sp. PCC 10023 TaxID=1680591 RepID=UPI0039C613E4